MDTEETENFAEISGENLEDLLAYDDLFLDYFNQFLVSSVFPRCITYNRLTGTFEEVSSEFGELSRSLQQALKYGATDTEREIMLEWAREKRLNLFLGSQLFLELKLCKQLLRPLDDQRSAGSQESSQNIRGYSRQTNSCVSSLSNGIGQTLETDAETFLQANLPFSAPMPRHTFYSQNSSLPSGRAVVDDGYLTSCTQKDRDTLMTNSKTPKSAVSSLKKNTLQSPHLKKPLPSHIATSSSSSICQSTRSGSVPKSSIKAREVTFSRENTMLSYNCDSEANKEMVKKAADDTSLSGSKRDFNRSVRALSAPVNYRDFLRIAWFSRFDVLFGMSDLVETADTYPYLQFQDAGTSDVNTDTDVRNMEGRLQMTLQEVKEHVIGSYHGMQRFKDFLANTAGCHLVKFWLHCELFKDCTENQEDQNLSRNRNQLFRDIQSKYKMSLTQEAREQIQRASTNVSLRHTIFIRTQYDVLRRLRAYWVPRFLLHLERNTDTLPSLSSSRRTTPKWLTRKEHYGSVHFPSITLNRLPLRPVNVWNDSHVTPAKDDVSQTDATCHVSQKLKNGSNHFLIAITNDRKFGGPFRQYLTSNEFTDLLEMLSFWEDVTDFGSGDTETTDQHLRHGRAWHIYHKYISNHDKQNIDICNKVRDTIYNTLLNTKGSVSASIFNPVKEDVAVHLETAWIRSLREDLKNYLDCKTYAQGGSPPSTAEAIDISLEDGKLVIKRPNPWIKRNLDVSQDSISQWSTVGKVNWMELNEEERRIRKGQIMEEKRRRDRNRKQAIKAAHKRRQEEKLLALKMKQEPEIPTISRESCDESPSLPTFKDFLDNKPVIASFKKCIQGIQNGPQVSHMINLYTEIENLKVLMASHGSKPVLVNKMTDLANHIQNYCAFNLTEDIDIRKSAIQNKRDSFKIKLLGSNDCIGHTGSRKITEIKRCRAWTYLSESSPRFIPLLSENGKLELMAGDKAVNPNSKVLDDIQTKIDEKIENAFGTFLMTRSDDAGISEEELAMMSPADLVTVLTKTEKDEISHVTKKPGGQRKKLKDWNRSSMSDFLPLSSRSDGFPGQGVKHAGQAVASRDDHLEFRQALHQCVSGQLSLQMIYFHIYLTKHADEDHLPFLDKDLFFFFECQKVKESLAEGFDGNERKRRIQNILENYLESNSPPPMKVDLSPDVYQRTMKMIQQYISSKKCDPTVFDEAQAHVFKEMVPYWAGFRRYDLTQNGNLQNKQTKSQKLLRIHDESLKNDVFQPKQVILPSIPHSTVRVLSFSLADGTKWRPASSLCSMHLSTASIQSKSTEQ